MCKQQNLIIDIKNKQTYFWPAQYVLRWVWYGRVFKKEILGIEQNGLR